MIEVLAIGIGAIVVLVVAMIAALALLKKRKGDYE